MMPTKPTVLIIGGGLGGLALAQILRKNNIPFRIFDRDVNATARSQGWCLSLHFILKDLKSELPEEIVPLLDTVSHLYNYGTDDDAAILNGVTGEEETHLGPDENTPFVRANRARLRAVLSTNLTVEYDKYFQRYEETASGITAYFADGTMAAGDILVGADGAHSLVRKQILGVEKAKNHTLPIEVCMGETTLNKAQYEHIFRDIAKSFYAVNASGLFFSGLYGVSDDKETARYYWMACQQKQNITENTTLSKIEYYHRAVNAVRHIQSRFLLPLYNTTPDEILNPPISLEDFVPPSDGLPGGRVTLLGDALHVMTPFRGSGGNLAMKDGLDLGSFIANSDGDILDSLRKYEDLAIPRAVRIVLDSRQRIMDWTDSGN